MTFTRLVQVAFWATSPPPVPLVLSTVFETVTLTGAEVPVLPAASDATAVSAWVPLDTVVVFQETE